MARPDRLERQTFSFAVPLLRTTKSLDRPESFRLNGLASGSVNGLGGGFVPSY
jgi:hypothetical protein